MKVMHLTFTYYPDPVGGTEVYVAALAHELRAHGIESVIAAPTTVPASLGTSERDGIRVHRYATRVEPVDLRDLYGEGDTLAASAFARVLELERPDVLHMHALTSAVSLRIARLARAQGIPVVYTYHTATSTCQRGTLMRDGEVVCDGEMIVSRCASCVLHGLGLARPVSRVAGHVPRALGGIARRAGLGGRLTTVLRMPELVAAKHDAFRELVGELSAVVAVCDWVHALLERNTVPAEKLVFSRQGVPTPRDEGEAEPRAHGSSGPTRIAFLGRLEPYKGAHLLVEAIAMVPHAPLELDIFGVAQGDSGARYLESLGTAVPTDTRVRIRPPLPAHAVVGTLREYDFLAVPSQWLETGPLVALEAFAAGVPVIGSRLGGIAELVRDGIDGLLVEPASSARAWAAVLERVTGSSSLRTKLRGGVMPPRTMAHVAAEMAPLYTRVVAAECPGDSRGAPAVGGRA